MKQFTVTGPPLFLFDGIISLTPSQAGLRKKYLEPLKAKDQYQITSQVCFKAGEVIGLPVPVAKTIRHQLLPVEPPE